MRFFFVSGLVLTWCLISFASELKPPVCDRSLFKSSSQDNILNFTQHRARVLRRLHGLGKFQYVDRFWVGGQIENQYMIPFEEDGLDQAIVRVHGAVRLVNLQVSQKQPTTLHLPANTIPNFIFERDGNSVLISTSFVNGVVGGIGDNWLNLTNLRSGETQRVPIYRAISPNSQAQFVTIDDVPYAVFGSKRRTAAISDHTGHNFLDLVNLNSGAVKGIELPASDVPLQVGRFKLFSEGKSILGILNSQGRRVIPIDISGGVVGPSLDIFQHLALNRASDSNRIGELQIFSDGNKRFVAAKAWNSVVLMDLDSQKMEEIPTQSIYGRGSGSSLYQHMGEWYFAVQSEIGIAIVNLSQRRLVRSWDVKGVGGVAVFQTRDHVFFVAPTSDAVLLLDALTGEVLHRFSVSPKGRPRVVQGPDGSAYALIGAADGYLYKLQLASKQNSP